MTPGIALLGTGTIAQHAFVPAVHAVEAARLVAVLSRDRAGHRAWILRGMLLRRLVTAGRSW